MTTSELIKLLKEIDPEGNTHVRLCGSGCPIDIDRLPGYWDGKYSYYNKDGKFVVTASGSKIDITAIEWEDYIWEHSGDYSNILLDMSAYMYEDKEKQDMIEKFEKVSKEYNECEKNSLENIFIKDMFPMFNKGWIVKETKMKVEEKKWNWFEWSKGIRKKTMAQGEISIMKGYYKEKNRDRNYYDVFEQFEKRGVKYWKLKKANKKKGIKIIVTNSST